MIGAVSGVVESIGVVGFGRGQGETGPVSLRGPGDNGTVGTTRVGEG